MPTTARPRPVYPLYHGACGVIWALRYLQRSARRDSTQSYSPVLDELLSAQPAPGSLRKASMHPALVHDGRDQHPDVDVRRSTDTGRSPTRIAATRRSNIENPTRELMWGAPGTMLAALFMHERSGRVALGRAVPPLGANVVVAAAVVARTRMPLLDAGHVRHAQQLHRRGAWLRRHGVVLIRGRHLLDEREWTQWQRCIENTVRRSATTEGGSRELARVARAARPGSAGGMLMQFCHGAPGFIILPRRHSRALRSTICCSPAVKRPGSAGPLVKGSNLCHGTGGNGYAFLKLYERTGDAKWLTRARAFAMHAIRQTEADAARYGRMRYSLWTGDPGLAIYLWDCINGTRALSDARCVLRRLIYTRMQGVFACPICRAPLSQESTTLVCIEKQRFDIAREGYVNLFPAHHRSRAVPATKSGWWPRGDDFSTPGTSRRCIAEFAATLAAARGNTARCAVDIGCGEGYFTTAVAAVGPRVYGIDVSKAAIRAAAKRYPSIDVCGGELEAPAARGRRVRRGDGDTRADRCRRRCACSPTTAYVVRVSPGPGSPACIARARVHGNTVTPARCHRVTRFRACGRASAPIHFRHRPEARADLIAMTPLLHRTREDQRQRALATEHLTIRRRVLD